MRSEHVSQIPCILQLTWLINPNTGSDSDAFSNFLFFRIIIHSLEQMSWGENADIADWTIFLFLHAIFSLSLSLSLCLALSHFFSFQVWCPSWDLSSWMQSRLSSRRLLWLLEDSPATAMTLPRLWWRETFCLSSSTRWPSKT